jgi:ELWxxDGT repeat protein
VDAVDTSTGSLQFTLTTVHGSLLADPSSNPQAAYFTAKTSSNKKFVQFTVPASSMSTALQGIIYKPDTDYYGADSVTVVVDDLGNTGYGPLCRDQEIARIPCHLMDNITIPINVQERPDRIDILVPEGVIYVAEDAAVTIPDIKFVNHDVAANKEDTDMFFHVSISCDYGVISLNNPSKHDVEILVGSGSLDSHVEFVGKVMYLNEAVKNLVFSPSKQFNSMTGGMVDVSIVIANVLNFTNVQVKPSFAQTKNRADIAVFVQAVNNPPELQVPGEIYAINTNDIHRVPVVVSVQTVYIDEDQTYSLMAMVVKDVDASDYPRAAMNLTLTAEHGIFWSHDTYTLKSLLALGPAPSRTPQQLHYQQSVSNANSSVRVSNVYVPSVISTEYRTVSLRGSLQQINFMLSKLIYIPDQHYFGADSISGTICDGCVGDGSAMVLSTNSAGQTSLDTDNAGDVLSVIAKERMGETSTCSLCASRTLPVFIKSVNDAPYWTLPRSSVLVSEDTTFAFGSMLAVNDVDSAAGELFVSLSVNFGVLTLRNTPLNVTLLQGTGVDDKQLQLLGTLSNINLVLQNLLYAPPLNWNSMKTGQTDQLSLYVDDNGNSGSANMNNTAVLSTNSDLGTGLTAVGTVNIVVVTGINHAPSWNLPGATYIDQPCQSIGSSEGESREVNRNVIPTTCHHIDHVDIFYITEDTPTNIVNVSINDADEVDRTVGVPNWLSVTITTLHGIVTLENYAQFGVLVTDFQMSQSNTTNLPQIGQITFIGALKGLNSALQSLYYTPPPNYYGPDSISLYVVDRLSGSVYGKFSNETIPMFVNPVPDLSTVTVPDYVLDVLEDQRLPIQGITVDNPDFTELVDGNPSYSRESFLGVNTTHPYNKTQPWQAAYQRIQQSGLVVVHITVQHGRVMFSAVSGLRFLNVANATAQTQEFGAYPASADNREVIRMIYKEAKASPFTDTTNDLITSMNSTGVGYPAQLWFDNVIISGRLYDIKRALKVVTYWSDNNWNSGIVDGQVTSLATQAEVLDIINITVYSPNAVADGVPPNSELIYVRVHAVNDEPVLLMPGSTFSDHSFNSDMVHPLIVYINRINGVEGMPIWVQGVSVVDVDIVSGNNFVTVTVNATHGMVSLPNASNAMLAASLSPQANAVSNVGLQFTIGSYVNSSFMTFMGPLWAVQTALTAVQFIPEQSYFGYDASIQFTVNDMGNVGLGGPLMDTRTIQFTIEPRNNAPTISIPADYSGSILFTLDEGSFSAINGAMNVLTGVNTEMNVSRAYQSGFELWKLQEPTVYSEGGAFGAGQFEWSTRELADIYPGYRSSNPSYYKVYKNQLYYAANDGVHGTELWRDSGEVWSTLQGEDPTVADPFADKVSAVTLFGDLTPGALGSNPSFLQTHGSYLYFAANGMDTTWMVDMQQRDTCGSFRQSSFDARIRFAVSESTVWNPSRNYDCPVGYHWASTEEGYRYFTSEIFGYENDRFWESNAGVELGESHGLEGYTHVGQVERSTSLRTPPMPYTYASECGWVGREWNNQSRTRFRFSDSHLTGAYKHSGHPDAFRPDIDDSFPINGQLITTEFAGIVCVAGVDVSCRSADCRLQGAGKELWRTDGSVEGTTRLEDINPGPAGSNPAFMTSFNGYLYFSAFTSTEGTELWRTKGTTYAQATMVSGVDYATSRPSTTGGISRGSESSSPADLTVAGTYLFFGATEPIHGRELWYITANQTFHAAHYIDIVSGTQSSNPHGFASSGGSLPVYFNAYTPAAGMELWASSGTAATTYMVKDIYPGSTGSNPQYLTWYSNALYFQADDGDHGYELWVHYPTSGSTQLLVDIRPGAPDSLPSFLTVFSPSAMDGKSYLVFSANDGHLTQGLHAMNGLGGSQLWRSDGTAAGTKRAFERTMNDFYFDKSALDLNHPATLAVFQEKLYISASYGEHNNIIPAGKSPFQSNNIDLARGFSQLAVVNDVDTHPTDNVTVVLQVDQGMMVLADKTNVPASSNSQLRILLAVRDSYTRVLLFNALTSLGHSVDMLSDSQSVYNQVVQVANQVMHSKLTLLPESYTVTGLQVDETGRVVNRTYDALLLGLNFHGEADPVSTTQRSALEWDGFQAIRMIRQWERETAGPQWAHLPGVSPNVLHLPIIAVSFINEVLNAKPEALAAGADLYLQLPLTYYMFAQPTPKVLSDITDTGVYRTNDAIERARERVDYDQFAHVVESYMTRKYQSVQITTTGDNQLSVAEMHKLPGLSVGSHISITGTLSQVNEVLRSGYFYARQGTKGQVTLQITVSDLPVRCTAGSMVAVGKAPSSPMLSSSMMSDDNTASNMDDDGSVSIPVVGVFTNSTAALSGVSTQLNGNLVTANLAFFSGFVGSSTFADSNHTLLNYPNVSTALCDSTNSSHVVTRSIPIFVTAVNQPPAIMLASANFSVTVDTFIRVPPIAIVDPDFQKQVLVSSYGLNVTAPLSLVMFCNIGRLTFPEAHGLVFLQGTGHLDGRVSIRGAFTAVNTALQQVLYQCRAQDGCFPGFSDAVTVVVDDEGYSGRGGPLTATQQISVGII